MECRRICTGRLGLAAVGCCLVVGAACARAGWGGEAGAGFTLRAGLFRHRQSDSQQAAAGVPLDGLPAGLREHVQHVLDRPTLFTHGPAEVFTCCPALYHWLLEHPDQAVALWRRLGAHCTDIQNRGGGVFGWSDGQGSEVRWWTIHRGPEMRVWYAEGSARAAGVLPLVPVRAVVVLRHAEGRSPSGRTLVQHQVDLFLQTDSRTAALVTRLMGPSAPRMAEQGAGQVEMFFSALAWYLDQHPAKAEEILLGILPPQAPEWRELRQRAQSPPTGETRPPAEMIHSGS
jgi:hypothetical protein